MKSKFIAKYMRQAKLVGQDSNPCQSRQIGVLIVDPDDNVVVGQGYNGPPAGVPHNTDPKSLKNFFWPQLSDDQKIQACDAVGAIGYSAESFAHKASQCDTCPRRHVSAGSGVSPNLCSCQHAERNAITKATRKLTSCIMFAWCGIPCIQCTGSIINAGIKTVHCLLAADYEPTARYLFQEAGVTVYEHYESSFEI
jgi:deoxycytidylate deaminase